MLLWVQANPDPSYIRPGGGPRECATPSPSGRSTIPYMAPSPNCQRRRGPPDGVGIEACRLSPRSTNQSRPWPTTRNHKPCAKVLTAFRAHVWGLRSLAGRDQGGPTACSNPGEAGSPTRRAWPGLGKTLGASRRFIFTSHKGLLGSEQARGAGCFHGFLRARSCAQSMTGRPTSSPSPRDLSEALGKRGLSAVLAFPTPYPRLSHVYTRTYPTARPALKMTSPFRIGRASSSFPPHRPSGAVKSHPHEPPVRPEQRPVDRRGACRLKQNCATSARRDSRRPPAAPWGCPVCSFSRTFRPARGPERPAETSAFFPHSKVQPGVARDNHPPPPRFMPVG